MSIIEVTDGPSHNRVDVALISCVNDQWQCFLKELQKPGEHGLNNNQLKQLVNGLSYAVVALQKQVLLLPAQGRQIGFKGSDLARVSEQMGRLRGPGG